MREFGAKALARLDQQLGSIKLLYESLPQEEKEQFRNWLMKLDAPSKEKFAWLRTSVKVSVSVPEALVGEEETISLKPIVLLKAIEAWETGEVFSPRSILNYL